MAIYKIFSKLALPVLLAGALIVCCGTRAQTPDEVKKIFPGQEAVFLQYSKEVRFFIKDDVPVAETKQLNEMMVLSEKNASRYSRYNVYHSGYNELTDLDAYTKIPDGSKYKKQKIGEQKTSGNSSNSVFYDDVKETGFDFPGLIQNAVTHLEYTQFHKDPHLLPQFYYFPSIPVLNLSYTVIVPDGINIKYVVKNDPTGLLQLTTEKKKKSTVYTWRAQNYKNPDAFGDAPDELYYVPHVIVHIASYEGKDGLRPFLNNLDELYKWNAAFTKELNITPDEALKKITDSLVVGKKNEKDKVKAIFGWVQQSIRYIAFENGLEGFRPRQAAEICRKRYGDCKDMSSIITQMLRMAGLKAYYTWIGTRSIPYDYSDVPLPIVDNHMISTVNLDGQWYFLDGTDPNAKFDMPPSSIQAKEALLAINENEYKVLRVPVMAAEKSVITDSTFISFTDDGVKGFESVTYSGYPGEDIYNSLMYRDEAGTKNFVKTRMGKASNKFILGEYTITRTNPVENIATISARFEIPGYGKKVGNEYYINLNLEKLFENQVIDTARRKVPKMFDYQYTIRQYHILEIPKGYTVSYKPADYSAENSMVKCKITYEIKNDKIIAAQEVQVKKLMIYPADFAEWNRVMVQIQSQYKESVSLEKK
jgi:hypothetical protein